MTILGCLAFSLSLSLSFSLFFLPELKEEKEESRRCAPRAIEDQSRGWFVPVFISASGGPKPRGLPRSLANDRPIRSHRLGYIPSTLPLVLAEHAAFRQMREARCMRPRERSEAPVCMRTTGEIRERRYRKKEFVSQYKRTCPFCVRIYIRLNCIRTGISHVFTNHAGPRFLVFSLTYEKGFLSIRHPAMLQRRSQVIQRTRRRLSAADEKFSRCVNMC